MKLADPAFSEPKIFIGGKWLTPAGFETIRVTNPATDALIATAPKAGAAEAEER